MSYRHGVAIIDGLDDVDMDMGLDYEYIDEMDIRQSLLEEGVPM